MNSSPILLYIETSGEICSVALSRRTELIREIVVKEPRAHARIIAPMVEEILNKSAISISDTDAIVVSEGPGSYTGLRVGVSVAKGLCFGSGKPLIAVGSLDLIAVTAAKNRSDIGSFHTIIPMIDARRMEVYTAVYSADAVRLSGIEAKIIDEASFKELLEKGKTLFCGDGAAKVQSILKHENAFFTGVDASAGGMLKPALDKYNRGEFQDVAYFEPFYLKDFVAGISKKGLLK